MHQNITELTTSDPYPIVSNDNGKIELVTSRCKVVDDSTQKTQYKYKHELHKYKIGESGEFILYEKFKTHNNQNTELNKLSDEEKNNLLGMSAKAIKKLLEKKVTAKMARRNVKLQQKEAEGKLDFKEIHRHGDKSLRRAVLAGQRYRIQIRHGQTLNAEFEINSNQNHALNKLSDKEKNSLLDMNAEDFKNYLSKKYKESRKLPSLPSKKNLNDNKSKKARLGAQQDNPLYFLAAVDSDVALGEQKTLSNDTHKSQDNGDTTTNLSKELGNNPQTKLANPNIKSANSSECQIGRAHV